MQSRPPISSYRFAKLIAWLCALLAWAATGALHRRRAPPELTKLRKMVWCVIVTIAGGYVRVEKRPLSRRYGDPPPKLVPMRAIGGAWLRQRLRTRGGFIEQVKHLIAALANRHALARRLAHRRRKAFTRLAPIAPCAGEAVSLRTVALAPAIANSS